MGTRLWLPTDATSATVAGWFDAQDASTFTLDTSNKVSEWRSKVGGWKVTQTTAAKQPTRNPTGRNNLPAVIFGENIILSGTVGSTMPTGAASGTISGVGSYPTVSTEYATIFTYGNRDAVQLRSVSAHSQKVSVGYYGNDADGDTTWTGFDRMFAAQISTTGASAIYVDGKSTAATAALKPLNTTINATAYIGGGASGDWWRNPVEELVLWAGILSDADRQRLMGYFAWRWNLVSQLPSDHPFKTAAPTISDAVMWTPAQLGSAVSLWVDTQDLNSITLASDGVGVTQWRSKVGNTYFAPANTSNPRLGLRNGRNFIEGGGNNAFFRLNSVTALPQNNDAATIVFVGRGSSGSYTPSITFGSSSSGAFRAVGTASPGEIAINRSGYDLASGRTYNSVGSVVVAQWDGGSPNNNVALFGSGTAIGSRTAPAFSGAIAGCTLLNYAPNDTNTDGVQAALIINRVLTAAERALVEGWAAWTFNMVSQLPSSHPYASAPPTISAAGPKRRSIRYSWAA